MVISGFGFVVGSFIGGGNIRVRVRGGQFYWWRKFQGSGSWWAVLLVEETSGFGFVVGSFIGGGNWSTMRKPPTSTTKSLTNFIT